MGPGVLHALARRPYGAAGALEVDEIWLPQGRPRGASARGGAAERHPRSARPLQRDPPHRRHLASARRASWRAARPSPMPTTRSSPTRRGLRRPRSGWPPGRTGPPTPWSAPPAGSCWSGANLSAGAAVTAICTGPSPTSRSSAATQIVLARRSHCDVPLALPGRVNVGNAAHAAAAAELLGVEPAAALAAMVAVAGGPGSLLRGRSSRPGRRGRLLLAKNPAGWVEMLELLDTEPDRPVIVDFNSRTADGRDPSWLWDVPFERLRGRRVLVTGERREDVGVRLAYADVPHTLYPNAEEAAAADAPEGLLDVVANYTAFRDLLVRTERRPRDAASDERPSRPPGSRSSIRNCSAPTATAATPRCWRPGCAGAGSGRRSSRCRPGPPLPGPVRSLSARRR